MFKKIVTQTKFKLNLRFINRFTPLDSFKMNQQGKNIVISRGKEKQECKVQNAKFSEISLNLQICFKRNLKI
ncbi:MAG: hypothetical protein COX07_04805 [Bacteroidetes bacterium CG23_combo_of_CG06-09_8_20_14_all_32_9]|nr:MAG: hypothetical protein COX07_04805 [Bacteroidetes bacterium CG23_combo_of_CG06-09_8_20_14_all_32_9]